MSLPRSSAGFSLLCLLLLGAPLVAQQQVPQQPTQPPEIRQPPEIEQPPDIDPTTFGLEPPEDLRPELSRPLTEEETQMAVQLAERGLREREISLETARIYHVDTQLVVRKGENATRGALVTHYRYSDDAALLTLVDLETQRVVSFEVKPHLPVPVSQEEFERARALAFEEPELQEIVGDREVEAEALVLRAATEEDPLFGHRVLVFSFRTEEGYITGLEVLVDLTEERVMIEQTQLPRMEPTNRDEGGTR